MKQNVFLSYKKKDFLILENVSSTQPLTLWTSIIILKKSMQIDKGYSALNLEQINSDVDKNNLAVKMIEDK